MKKGQSLKAKQDAEKMHLFKCIGITACHLENARRMSETWTSKVRELSFQLKDQINEAL